MPGFQTGIGAQAFVVISFLIAVASGWVLLRRRLPRIAAGLVIALAIGLVYVVAIFDAVGHTR
jgi:LPXTG-motif cell wall-anchored protein